MQERLLTLNKINENFFSMEYSDLSILYDIDKSLTYKADGYRYTMAYKFKKWDGDIHLIKNGMIPVGILSKLFEICKKKNIKLQIEGYKVYNLDKNLDKFISDLSFLDKRYIPIREYQKESFIKCIKMNRSVILSPTGSGKSLIIYLLVRFFLFFYNIKIVISVPSTLLVDQLIANFKEYDNDGYVSCNTIGIHSKIKKVRNINEYKVHITTWQSLSRQDVFYFKNIKLFIADECHTSSAKILTSIIETNLTDTIFRYGFTATLKDTKLHELQVRSLFGEVVNTATTKELIDKGDLSRLKIKFKILEYPLNLRNIVKGLEYQSEIDFIVKSNLREEYLVELVKKLDKNCIILFRYVDTHAKRFFNRIKESLGKEVYYLERTLKVEEKNAIKELLESKNNIVVVSTFGILSLGVSINNVHYLVFGHPYKSKITILQSIGRVLRLHENKNIATIIDIVDDFSIKEDKFMNITYFHFLNRKKLYDKEKHPYEIERISLG